MTTQGLNRKGVACTRARAAQWLFIILALACFKNAIAAQTLEPTTGDDLGIRVVAIAEDLENPWGMVILPDGRILVSERPGRLRVVEAGKRISAPVEGLPEIIARGQGGLLDLALHPNYRENGWIYISYVAGSRRGFGTEVLRARLKGNRLQDQQLLFRMLPKSGGGRHFGSRLLFDREGYLYITLGDRGEKSRAQQLDDHAGSVIRLNDDGSLPQDNPFVGNSSAKPGIFSYGHRNPQGMALHPETGEIWIHEHGPQGGDEINIVHKGLNYGWPVITYGVNYGFGTPIGKGTHQPGMEQPLYYWVPSIAPSGMCFYKGERFPEWNESLFVGSLKFGLLVRLQLDGNQVVGEERLLGGRLGRIRDVRCESDGYLYLLTDAAAGGIYRLEPN